MSSSEDERIGSVPVGKWQNVALHLGVFSPAFGAAYTSLARSEQEYHRVVLLYGAETAQAMRDYAQRTTLSFSEVVASWDAIQARERELASEGLELDVHAVHSALQNVIDEAMGDRPMPPEGLNAEQQRAVTDEMRAVLYKQIDQLAQEPGAQREQQQKGNRHERRKRATLARRRS